jgi:hypothetical protein
VIRGTRIDASCGVVPCWGDCSGGGVFFQRGLPQPSKERKNRLASVKHEVVVVVVPVVVVVVVRQ